MGAATVFHTSHMLRCNFDILLVDNLVNNFGYSGSFDVLLLLYTSKLLQTNKGSPQKRQEFFVKEWMELKSLYFNPVKLEVTLNIDFSLYSEN